jgi:hypothetical protein
MNGTAIVASTGNITLNGNINANSQVISPTKIGYLSNLTQDVNASLVSLQSQITSLSSSSSYSSLSVSGTSTLNIVNISGLLTISSGLYTGTNTISNTCFNYISTLTSDAQIQITSLSSSISTLNTKCTNIGYSAGITSISGTCQTTGTLNCNAAVNFKGATSLNSGFVFTILGNLSANSTTITPVEISYLYGATSNIQTQITTLTNKLTNISYSSSNTTISGNLTMGSTTSYIDLSGCTGTNAGLKVSSTVYVSPSVLNYISNLTTDCQTQLNFLEGKTLNQSFNTVSYTTTFTSNLQLNGIAYYFDLSACTNTNSGIKCDSSTYLNATQLTNLANGLIKTPSTPLTYTSDSNGYFLSTSTSSVYGVAMSYSTYSYSSSLSLGVGVWSISGQFSMAASGNAVITKYVQIVYTSSGTVIPGTLNSFNSSNDSGFVYTTNTGYTNVVITSASTNIRLAFKVNSSICSYYDYYLQATKIA